MTFKNCWIPMDELIEMYDQELDIVELKSLDAVQPEDRIMLGFTPILREETLGVVRGFLPLFPSTNLTRRHSARRLFKVPPCREDTVHLQTSMSSPGFEPRPNSTAVRIANHYTGWVTVDS
ncbi:hypothetical protein TNCV_3892291 [Trichonephila clavipes]|nr:hypothetical protein TNCV_3892291 [Trichonephila clavipes]